MQRPGHTNKYHRTNYWAKKLVTPPIKYRLMVMKYVTTNSPSIGKSTDKKRKKERDRERDRESERERSKQNSMDSWF